MVDVRTATTVATEGIDGNAYTPLASSKTSYFGAWPIFHRSEASCTTAFSLWNSASATPGVLTAGHCNNDYMTFRYPADGSMIALPNANPDLHGGWNDFQVHWTPGKGTNGSFWVDNEVSGEYLINCNLTIDTCEKRTFRNAVSFLSVPQYINVVDVIRGGYGSFLNWNPNHPIDALRCRYGRMTGIVCGKITHSDVDGIAEGSDGSRETWSFVRVAPLAGYQATAMGGDSGGPVFSSIVAPTSGSATAHAAGIVSSTNLKATGLLTTGMRHRPCINGNDTDCFYDYMPIDRINDDDPNIKVLQYSGTAYTPLDVE